jgi:hypothetical protein
MSTARCNAPSRDASETTSSASIDGQQPTLSINKIKERKRQTKLDVQLSNRLFNNAISL